MRFILLLATLMGCAQIYAQSFSDSKYMDRGVEQPRTQSIIGDKEGADNLTSKFVIGVEEWSNSSNNYSFESKFSRPFSWIGRQLYLRVDSASAPYTLYINDKEIGKTQNSSSPAEFNITSATKEGRNTITIKIDEESIVAPIEGWKNSSPSLSSNNPKATLGNVRIVSQPTQMIRDLKIETSLLGDKLNSQIHLIIKSHALSMRTSTVHYSLYHPNGEMVSFGRRDITQSMRGEDTIIFNTSIPTNEGWSAENPQLFTLKLSIQHEGRYLEYQSYNVGFRAIEVDPSNGKFTINGSQVALQATRVNSESVDLDEIKSLGFNTIKIEGGTPPYDLYSACDKMGIYVIASTPINSASSSPLITKGGNPTNDPTWWGAYIQRVDASYHTAQLHPSVIAFSVADNSLNGYNLYEGYLRLKQKQTTRPVIYFEAEGEWNSDKLDITLK